MTLSMATIARPERDTVSGLAIGYENDAREEIPFEDQYRRLFRWYWQGWDERMYHLNILALVIGYQRKRLTDV